MSWGRISLRVPCFSTRPSLIMTISSAMFKIRSWWEMMRMELFCTVLRMRSKTSIRF